MNTASSTTSPSTKGQVHSVDPFFVWLELSLITSLGLLIGYWVRPDDPFFLNQPFTWTMLPPMLVALRYGFFYGFISGMLLVAAVGVAYRVNWVPLDEFPYTYAIGIMFVVMLTGEFRDHWQKNLDQLNVTNTHRQLRLDEFTRSHHLLKVSHDRLEQQLAGSGQSLREAIRSIHRMIILDEEGLSPQTAKSILNILVEYGSLQICAIAVIDHGVIQSKPIAHVGFTEDIPVDDPLLIKSFQTNTLISMGQDISEDTDQQSSSLLVCIPISDCTGFQWAMLVVEKMSFFALQDKTLRLLAIIAGHTGDLLNFKKISPHTDAEPVQQFYLNLERSLLDKTGFDVPAIIVMFAVHDSYIGEQVINVIKRMRRGLDLVVEEKSENRIYLCLLLPLTDKFGYEGYRLRLEDFCRQELGKNMAELDVRMAAHEIERKDKLIRFLREHKLNGEKMVGLVSDIP
ncbi:hypothetical protein A9Q99_00475 [Gammaproteobacteria bacterium 45_16_T64]|nr:hypothetical protein A9Q99_00475 [Gammaproteobacteria bacterium 45_16_T64]